MRKLYPAAYESILILISVVLLCFDVSRGARKENAKSSLATGLHYSPYLSSISAGQRVRPFRESWQDCLSVTLRSA